MYLAKVAATVDVDLRRPGRDGDRRRLVRARVERLRLRLPPRRRPDRHARRGRGDHAPGLGRRVSPRSPASTTRWTARSAGRCRCSPAASRCGSPAAARRRRCGSPRSTPPTPTSTGPWRASGTSRRCSPGTAATSGRDFDEIVRSANYNVVIGRDEAEVEDRLRRLEDRYRPFLSPEQLAANVEQYRTGPLVGTPEQIVERLRALAGRGHDVRDHLLPGGGVRRQRRPTCSPSRSCPRRRVSGRARSPAR